MNTDIALILDPNSHDAALADQSSPKNPLSPELRALMLAWKDKRREDVHRKVAAQSAKISRDLYRAAREAEGKTVRPYTFHNHLPQQPHETREDYERRLHRDRQRSYAKAGGTKRARADLSSMTEEERAEHKREAATERKRRERAAEKTPPSASVEMCMETLPEFGQF